MWLSVSKRMNVSHIQGSPQFLQKVYAFYLLQFEYLILPISFRVEVVEEVVASGFIESVIDNKGKLDAPYPIQVDVIVPEEVTEEEEEEEDVKDGKYIAKSRYITTHGGIDFDRIMPILKQKMPAKEQYGKLFII